MRYQPDESRYDDPLAMRDHVNRYAGGVALVVLGGYSAKNWASLYAEIKPDVIIGANGVNAEVENLDYWILAENMTRSNRMAQEGNADAMRLMQMFHRESGAKNKLVSWRSWSLLKDTRNCYKIRRQGYELSEIESFFSFREYGLGLLSGWELKHKEAGATVHVGTVGAQCLHLAGILGCREVHTIGYDLMFREESRHHFYDYPVYREDKFRTPEFRQEYKGVSTQWTWIETAQWLKSIEYLFARDGLNWVDHSDGLLKLEGLRCAQ